HDAFWIAGFSMGRVATGVQDDLWERAVTFERGDVRVGLVAHEFVGMLHPAVRRIRRGAREAGLDFDHVLVATTHYHEAPDTMGIWRPDPSASGYDEAYVAFVVEQAVGALADAKAAERRAHLEVAQARTPGLIRDSR